VLVGCGHLSHGEPTDVTKYRSQYIYIYLFVSHRMSCLNIRALHNTAVDDTALYSTLNAHHWFDLLKGRSVGRSADVLTLVLYDHPTSHFRHIPYAVARSRRHTDMYITKQYRKDVEEKSVDPLNLSRGPRCGHMNWVYNISIPVD